MGQREWKLNLEDYRTNLACFLCKLILTEFRLPMEELDTESNIL